MVNVIAVLALLAIVGASAFYVIRAKKKGQRCIGCPHARECAARKNGGCGTNQK